MYSRHSTDLPAQRMRVAVRLIVYSRPTIAVQVTETNKTKQKQVLGRIHHFFLLYFFLSLGFVFK